MRISDWSSDVCSSDLEATPIELTGAGIPIGVASSSSFDWVDKHLTRLELRDHFGAVVGSDVVGGVGKPAPDVYLRACADLGVEPSFSVAIEDSAHGATAAKAAGMAVVAVPRQITRFNDFRDRKST